MTTRKINLSESGTTLIETLVALFVIVLTVGYSSIAMMEQRKTQKWAETMAVKDDIANDLVSELSLYDQCGGQLRAAMGTGAIADEYDGAINAVPFAEEFDSNNLTISKVSLKYKVASVADAQKASDYNSYEGTMLFEVEPKIKPKEYIRLRPIGIPITIHDPKNQKQWADVVCTTPLSETTSLVAQTCSLYGGSLLDATHCDFSRVLRTHRTGDVPVVGINNGANTQRMNLSDVLCYIDTLIAVVPNPDFSVAGPRDHSRDRYGKDYITRYCKRPGIVKYADSVKPEILFTQMSKDVKDDITDINSFKPICAYLSYNFLTQQVECVGTCSMESGYFDPDNGVQWCFDSFLNICSLYPSLCF